MTETTRDSIKGATACKADQDARTLFIRFSQKQPETGDEIKKLYPNVHFVRTIVRNKAGIDYAFIEFENVDECIAAKNKLIIMGLKGKEVFVDIVGDSSNARKKPRVKDQVPQNPNRLFICNLPQGVKRTKLQELFPTAVTVSIPQRSKKNGFVYGFVQFRSPAEAKAALDASQDAIIANQKITVLLASRSELKQELKKNNGFKSALLSLKVSSQKKKAEAGEKELNRVRKVNDVEAKDKSQDHIYAEENMDVTAQTKGDDGGDGAKANDLTGEDMGSKFLDGEDTYFDGTSAETIVDDKMEDHEEVEKVVRSDNKYAEIENEAALDTIKPFWHTRAFLKWIKEKDVKTKHVVAVDSEKQEEREIVQDRKENEESRREDVDSIMDEIQKKVEDQQIKMAEERLNETIVDDKMEDNEEAEKVVKSDKEYAEIESEVIAVDSIKQEDVKTKHEVALDSEKQEEREIVQDRKENEESRREDVDSIMEEIQKKAEDLQMKMAEERLKMINEQMKIENKKVKLRKIEEKAKKKDQKIILGKNNCRPKIVFSFNSL